MGGLCQTWVRIRLDGCVAREAWQSFEPHRVLLQVGARTGERSCVVQYMEDGLRAMQGGIEINAAVCRDGLLC